MQALCARARTHTTISLEVISSMVLICGNTFWSKKIFSNKVLRRISARKKLEIVAGSYKVL
jgi:hypothetical protein